MPLLRPCRRRHFYLRQPDWSDFSGDVLIMGELHDNPQHHAEQARAVQIIQPKAVVFEMLTPEEAQSLADVPRDPDAMRVQLKASNGQTSRTTRIFWPQAR